MPSEYLGCLQRQERWLGGTDCSMPYSLTKHPLQEIQVEGTITHVLQPSNMLPASLPSAIFTNSTHYQVLGSPARFSSPIITSARGRILRGHSLSHDLQGVQWEESTSSPSLDVMGLGQVTCFNQWRVRRQRLSGFKDHPHHPS